MKYLSVLLLSAVLFAAPFETKHYDKPHAKGLLRSPKSRSFLEMKKSARREKLTGIAPGKYDLTPRVSPPLDQGPFGTCWAFGLTKALWSAFKLVGTDLGQPAVNYLIGNCGPGPSQGMCNNGGDFDAGQSFLNGHGPWLEAQDPYGCPETGCKNLPKAYTALTYEVVGSGNGAPSFQDLALAVSQNHELVIDVAVCGDWENYSSGIFNSNQCGSNSINHIINLNGYDCETSVDKSGDCVFNTQGEPVNGDGYLIVMNNWGTSWGENGLMRTRAHVDAVADTAMYFTVAQPPPPPTPTPVPPTPVPPAPTPDGKFNWDLAVEVLGCILVIGFVVIFGVRLIQTLKGEGK